MQAEKYSVALTTIADGSVTGYTPPVTGRILSVRYEKNDFANGVDFAVTGEDSGESIWAENDVNASTIRYPRSQVHDTDGTLLTRDGTRKVCEPIVLANERVKIVIAQGGNVKSGTVHVIIG